MHSNSHDIRNNNRMELIVEPNDAAPNDAAPNVTRDISVKKLPFREDVVLSSCWLPQISPKYPTNIPQISYLTSYAGI